MFTNNLAFRFDSSLDRVFALKSSAEVHAGRLSIPLQALTYSVANVLKDLDPLVDENISTSKHGSSKWAEQSLAYRVGFQPARPQS